MSKIAMAISILTIPLVGLNLLAGLIGGVWLIVLGEWGDALWAIVVTYFSTYLISLILMIPLAMLLPAAFLLNKGFIGKVLSFPFQLLSSISTWLIVGFWGLFVFSTALGAVGDNPVMPYLLIAYGISVGTWGFMASKEGDSEQYAFLLLASQLSSAFLLIALGLLDIAFIKMITIYFAILLSGFVLQIITGFSQLVRNREN